MLPRRAPTAWRTLALPAPKTESRFLSSTATAAASRSQWRQSEASTRENSSAGNASPARNAPPARHASTAPQHHTQPQTFVPPSAASTPTPFGDAFSPPAHVLTHPSIPDLQILLLPHTIALHCPSLGIHEPFLVDHTWLRDACQEMGTSLQLGTGQKLTHTTDVPIATPQQPILERLPHLAVAPSAPHELCLVLTYSPHHPVLNAFSTTFSSRPPVPPAEPHVSHLPLSLILSHANEQLYRQYHIDPAGAARPWDASDLTAFPASGTAAAPPPKYTADVCPSPLDAADAEAKPARVDYSALVDAAPQRDSARWALARGLVEEGLVFVRGVSTGIKGGDAHSNRNVDGSSPDCPELARLASMLGEIRHTFYAPLWDVRSLPSAQSKNIAYTNVDLGLHMDLLYFQNPPRFQFLHMLRNWVTGGQSIFVDAYKVAETMWQGDREAWDLLTKVPIAYHYQNDNRHYRYSHPLFELPPPVSGHAGPSFAASSSSSGMPRLTAVNYSPPFQAPLPLPSTPLLQNPSTRTKFYAALARFAQLTLQPEYRYERQLNEGECVIFDNRRVLHSRMGFDFDVQAGEASAASLPGGGRGGKGEESPQYRRWLKGCYVDGDAVWSSYRVLGAKVGGLGVGNALGKTLAGESTGGAGV